MISDYGTIARHDFSSSIPSQRDDDQVKYELPLAIEPCNDKTGYGNHLRNDRPIDDTRQFRLSRWVSGPGMFSSFFNLALINTAKPLMRENYGQPTPRQESLMTSASLAGAVVGQILLGTLADHIGRKRASLLSASLATVGAFGSAMARPLQTDSSSIYTVVTLARFILGIGAGGDYPILASITTESVTAEDSAVALIHNSIMIGSGAVAAQLMYVVLIAMANAETAWRGTAAIGGLLSLSMLATRQLLLPVPPASSDHQRAENTDEDSLKLPQTILFDVEEAMQAEKLRGVEHQGQAAPLLLPKNRATEGRLETSGATLNLREMAVGLARPILATSACWMLYDMVDFSLGMYSSDILGSSEQPQQGAVMTLLANATTIIGAMAAMKLIEPHRLGPNTLQTLGFTGIAACHLLLAIGEGHFWQDGHTTGGVPQIISSSAIQRTAFLSLYAIQQLFDAGGAAIGIYVIPSEIFPSPVRSTCMGIASSAGKIGAVLGTAAMPFIRQSGGMQTVFLATSLLSALAAVITWRSIPHYDHDTLRALDSIHSSEGSRGVMQLLYP